MLYFLLMVAWFFIKTIHPLSCCSIISKTYINNTMDKIRKFDLMQKIVHELEDLKNSQAAVIQKLAKIEVDNIDLGDKRLDKDLPDMHQRVADNLDAIKGVLEYFASQTDTFNNQNNITALKEQEAINNL
jgi:Mg2+ and Co2+ transporter CorA